jgi:hypothetical protein
MSKSRKTGNKLFDIVWDIYPPRINGLGIAEKKNKKRALAYFERKKPTEETVFDMVAWIKADNENRDKSIASGKFYSAPGDLIAFLNQEKWIFDEIGTSPTKTDRFETRRSDAIQNNNTKNAINDWKAVIKEWPIERLVGNPRFMAARQYPGFREWALEQRPDLRGAKAEIVAPVVAQEAVAEVRPVPVNIEPVPVTQDLPPPSNRERKLAKMKEFYNDLKKIPK